MLALLLLGKFPREGGSVDYHRTPWMIGYVVLWWDHVYEYLWLCFGLSVLAAFHFACKVLGADAKARASGWIYLALKSPFTAAVAVLAVVIAILMHSKDLADITFFHRDGRSGIVAVETMGVLWPVMVEAFLSIPVWLIVILRSWRPNGGVPDKTVAGAGRS
jgi:hypothetical protein